MTDDFRDEPLPCFLLTGILGSGKTTLVNHLLRNTDGRRFAVIVNELGAIDVDGALIETDYGPQLSLANGCICCTINGDLEQSVLDFLKANPGYDGLIVEASGVADPQPIVNTFVLSEALRPLVRIDSVIAMVDLEAFPLLRGQNAYLARRQAAAADLVLLNKKDLVSEAQLSSVLESLAQWVPRLRAVPCTQAQVPLELVVDHPRFQLEQLPPGAPVEVHVHTPGDHHAHGCSGHRADQLVLDTWTYQGEGRFRPRALADLLKRLPIGVYRVKGFVRLQGEAEEAVFSVQLCGTRLDVRLARAALQGRETENRLVFIAEEGALDVADLTEKLQDAQKGTQEPKPVDELMEKVKRLLAGSGEQPPF